MKFSSNIIMVILLTLSSLFLYSCSHNSCPAYTYQKNNDVKKEENNIGKNIDYNRGV